MTSSVNGLANSLMNSHAAAGDELVDLAVGEPPHERLVLLEPLRRDQPHQQRAVVGVLRRVERRELVAHRQLVAVLLDERR